MPDTLHLALTAEDLKDLLRRGFAYGALATAMEPTLDEFVLLVRRVGFTGLLELLKSAEQELTPRPSYPPYFDLTEHARQNEAAIAAFDARLQELPQTYQPGDRVEFQGEVFLVHRYQRGGGMTGYWLRKGKEEMFMPRDWEGQLRPVAH